MYDLAYDGGGSRWHKFYRTRWGAHIARWWNLHVASWGGTADLVAVADLDGIFDDYCAGGAPHTTLARPTGWHHRQTPVPDAVGPRRRLSVDVGQTLRRTQGGVNE